MNTGMKQSMRMGQELKINPRLYQAMDMLYMPLLDLQQHLKQELLVNPFLDLVEEEEDEAEAGEETAAEADATNDAEIGETPAAADSDDESQWEEILLNGFDVGGVQDHVVDAGDDLLERRREVAFLVDVADELLGEQFVARREVEQPHLVAQVVVEAARGDGSGLVVLAVVALLPHAADVEAVEEDLLPL